MNWCGNVNCYAIQNMMKLDSWEPIVQNDFRPQPFLPLVLCNPLVLKTFGRLSGPCFDDLLFLGIFLLPATSVSKMLLLVLAIVQSCGKHDFSQDGRASNVSCTCFSVSDEF